MLFRPADAANRLGISPATLRVWSNQFGSFLEPAARQTVTGAGGGSQRRYSEADIAILSQVKQLLGSGKTYEFVRRVLANEPLSGEVVSPGSDVPTSLGQALAPREDTGNHLAALQEEHMRALSALESLYKQHVAAKDETIQVQWRHIEGQNERIEELIHYVRTLETQLGLPSSESSISVRRSWWQRLRGK